MAIDETLCAFVRAAFGAADAVREVKMFGGVGFLLNDNLVAACSDRGLLLRVGEAGMATALASGAQPMQMRGRPVNGYVRVVDGLERRAVNMWVRRARSFVETLPPKKAKAKARTTKKKRTTPT